MQCGTVAATVAEAAGEWATATRGWALLPEEAAAITRHPKGSALRALVAANTHPDVVSALGHLTAAHVLEDVGLL